MPIMLLSSVSKVDIILYLGRLRLGLEDYLSEWEIDDSIPWREVLVLTEQ